MTSGPFSGGFRHDQGGALDPAQPARDEASLTGTALGKLTSTSVSPIAAGADRGEAHQAVPQAVCVHAQTG